jgi:hypothetical protein
MIAVFVAMEVLIGVCELEGVPKQTSGECTSIGTSPPYINNSVLISLFLSHFVEKKISMGLWEHIIVTHRCNINAIVARIPITSSTLCMSGLGFRVLDRYLICTSGLFPIGCCCLSFT